MHSARRACQAPRLRQRLCCCRYARAGARVAAALLGTEHMAEALAQILDAPPPPEASSAAQDPLAVARYASRPLALQVVRLACQASAGVAAAAHALGASPGLEIASLTTAHFLTAALRGYWRLYQATLA